MLSQSTFVPGLAFLSAKNHRDAHDHRRGNKTRNRTTRTDVNVLICGARSALVEV